MPALVSVSTPAGNVVTGAEPADDEVGFPMADGRPGLDLGRALVDQAARGE